MFTVRRGGGKVNGQDQVSVVTGDTGHAEVNFTLGSEPGNNEVDADFTGNAGIPAFFVSFGVVREEEQPTSFSGLVLDNGGRPIGGAMCDLVIGQDPPLTTTTDGQGQFRFDDLAASGPAELHVDGLAATTVNGEPVPQGSFPSLQYEIVLVPNAQNSLPTPVLLPPLNPNNAVAFDNTQDVDLTVEGIEGLKMTVKAGSMTRADGTVPSPADPAILALNQVHFDDVPMPMPDGAAPPFAWTLQPGGATFDPPVEIVYPNMSGLPAGSIAYFLSFNHDTGRFEIIATGQVTSDGSSIVSDPGAGIVVSGWGCNCPPYSVTGDCEKCSCSATIGDAVIKPGESVDVDCVITNTSTASASGDCTFDWRVSKTAGTPTVNPMPDSGSVTLSKGASANVSLPISVPSATQAKDAATIELTVTGEGSCSDTAEVCVKPTGENTAPNGWHAGGIHKWTQTLLPTAANFETRKVTEQDPGGGGPDTCWFMGSAFAPFEAITGGDWPVGPANAWGDDFVGWFGTAVTFYRANGRAPCGTSFPQRMVIDCPSGATEYRNNVLLEMSMTATSVTSERDGQSATRVWP